MGDSFIDRIKKIFTKQSSEKVILPAYFYALEISGLDKLSTQVKCRAIRNIQEKLWAYGTQNKLISEDELGNRTLSADGFIREIDLMAKIAESLTFTPQFQEWIDDRLKACAHRLAREHTNAQMSVIWRKMNEADRLGYLNTVQVMLHHHFSDDVLRLTPPQMILKKGRMSNTYFTLAAFDRGLTPLEYKNPYHMHIHPINLMDNSYSYALGAVVHETLHSVMCQIARMEYHGQIPKGHPFKQDAELLLTCINEHSYIPAIFHKAYLADPEERIAYKHENFGRIYAERSAHRILNTDRVGRRPE